MKAAEKHLFDLRDMEEMVEFMKTEVPNWDVQTLQACIHETALWKLLMRTRCTNR